MMEQMELEHQGLADEAIVFWGGPVQPERGFVVHRQPGGWASSMEVANGLYITTSRDILRAIGLGKGPNDYIVVLGSAGWERSEERRGGKKCVSTGTARGD